MASTATGTRALSSRPAGAITTTSVRGQTVRLFGHGICRYDTLFTGARNRGTDVVTLFLAIPLLLVVLVTYRRGSLRGAMLLLGALSWFVYTGASYALGAVAYNDLFLVYVALLAASLWTFLRLFTSFDHSTLRSHFVTGMPRRGLAVITVGAFISGRLILRRPALDYLGTFAMLVLEAMLAPMFMAQMVSQVSAGEILSTGEIVGPVAGFILMAVVAVQFIVAVLRNVSGTAPGRRTWS